MVKLNKKLTLFIKKLWKFFSDIKVKGNSMSGLMIAVEGIDGSGKSSFITNMSMRLDKCGFKTIILSEASFKPIKQIIDNLIKGQNQLSYNAYVHLYLSLAEYVILEPQIDNYLSRNYIIFFDRYIYSTIVYSAALGIEFDWVEKFKNIVKKPDVVLLCEQTPEKAWKSKKGKIESIEKGFTFNNNTDKENFIEFQSSVARYYNKIKIYDSVQWKKLNCYCNNSVDKIQQFIVEQFN